MIDTTLSPFAQAVRVAASAQAPSVERALAHIQRDRGGRIVVASAGRRSRFPPRSQAKGRGVAGIESEVLETFLAALTDVDDVPQQVTQSLAVLLAADKLPKPDQLVALYTDASGESAL